MSLFSTTDHGQLTTDISMPNVSGSNHYSSQQIAIARRTSNDFVPDGDLSKPAWSGPPKVSLISVGLPGVPTRGDEAKTEASALWTPHHVYFAFWCHFIELNIYEGEDIAKERWELWNRDVVEVFVNPFPEKLNAYWEFEVAPNNQWIDLAIDLDQKPGYVAAWASGFEHQTKIDLAHKQWTCEMRIPVSAFGVDQLEPGVEWRINYYRCDGRGDDSQRRFLAWSPTMEETFHVPKRFGVIQFEE